jgi:YesN/AraC family two-component response regulator
MKIYIKNMVSLRCKLVVKDKFEKLGIKYKSIELGEVEIMEPLPNGKKHLLIDSLHKEGLELMDDKRSMLIEKIKNVIVEMVHYEDEFPKMNFSEYLNKKMGYNYTYLANIFSEVKGTTIEHFIITHKIERAKELLVYNELSLKEISNKLNYNSVSHLSTQFKKITGLTPTHFKKLSHKRRNMLEDI